MTNKTYNQFCAIAHTLDFVGERWTLLVVRNLLLGAKRFSDLMKGLPGISTNILTERLKVLEENGIVTTRFLPPPAASTVYELTERGYTLVDTLSALARWGSTSLGKPQAEQLIVPEAIGFMVLGVFHRRHKGFKSFSCDVHVEDDRFNHHFAVNVSEQGAVLSDEYLLKADSRLQIGLEALSALSSGRTHLQTLLDSNEARLEGSAESSQALLIWVDER